MKISDFLRGDRHDGQHIVDNGVTQFDLENAKITSFKEMPDGNQRHLVDDNGRQVIVDNHTEVCHKI